MNPYYQVQQVWGQGRWNEKGDFFKEERRALGNLVWEGREKLKGGGSPALEGCSQLFLIVSTEWPNTSGWPSECLVSF